MDSLLAAVALFVSFGSLLVAIFSLLISVIFFKRALRPIVTVAVKTHSGGNMAITYDLVVLNSGTLPARNIRITATESSLSSAFGRDASEANKTRWLACFNHVIDLLQNNDRKICSFGTSQVNDTGFWKYDSPISITLTYEDLFGKRYKGNQKIKIIDSDSFTGFSWEISG